MTLQDLYATAVSRETTWFRSDQSAHGLPSLAAFATVGDYPHDINRRQREIFLWRELVEYSRFGGGGRVRLLHHLVATIKWPIRGTAGAANADQQALDTAIGAVVMRIGGLFGDKTHGGAFEEAGEEGDVRIEYGDPNLLEKDERLHVHIKYTAADSTVG